MIDCELPTEGRNPRTLDVDTLPTLEVLHLINTEDATVPMVVAAVLPEVARLVDLAVDSLRAGGRVHYFGAGTSGRLAVIDEECRLLGLLCLKRTRLGFCSDADVQARAAERQQRLAGL